MLKRVITLVGLLLILMVNVGVANEANLDSPAITKEQPTIKQEIIRGSDVSLDSALKDWSSPLTLDNGVTDAIYKNQKDNTCTTAFLLGLYTRAWIEMDNKSTFKSVPERFKGFTQDKAQEYYQEFRKYQQQLNISDEQLFEVMKVKSTANEKLKKYQKGL